MEGLGSRLRELFGGEIQRTLFTAEEKKFREESLRSSRDKLVECAFVFVGLAVVGLLIPPGGVGSKGTPIMAKNTMFSAHQYSIATTVLFSGCTYGVALYYTPSNVEDLALMVDMQKLFLTAATISLMLALAFAIWIVSQPCQKLKYVFSAILGLKAVLYISLLGKNLWKYWFASIKLKIGY